ncbi:MAG: MBL fold metallo-hydrolase [Actinomycetota bacterium]|nr:MBL fold metallo-hydrolase [Actinomycetota bacterium]
MRQIFDDLWETRPDDPFPGLTTHAYLWTPARALFYSPATDSDFEAIRACGGVAHHYLSHRDEAGTMLKTIAEEFNSTLHAPAPELADISAHHRVDVAVRTRHTDGNGVEVIPTPGHTPGSTCYLVTGAQGRYLFTGDTLIRNTQGQWWAGYLAGMSDADSLAASLKLLATLRPDVVISSAYQGDSAVHRIGDDWQDLVAQALDGLCTDSRNATGD